MAWIRCFVRTPFLHLNKFHCMPVCVLHFIAFWSWSVVPIAQIIHFHKIIENPSFFCYPPSSGIASCVGTAGTVMWRLHLTRSCCVALGRVLIWVVSLDWSSLRLPSALLCEKQQIRKKLQAIGTTFLRQREYGGTSIIAGAIATI